MAEKLTGSAMMFKMRQLPKPEYKLLKALAERYHLKDDSEVVAVALRLTYEVLRMHNGHVADGEQWWLQCVSTYRTATQEQRQYVLPGEDE